MEYEKEYLEYVEKILTNKEFLKRKEYCHHENLSVYEHSLEVSYKSYLYAKRHKLDTKSIAIGGLLHDFYDKPWQESTEHKKFLKQHGFVHAKEALLNSRKYFNELMNPKIEDIILKHMFPLNKNIPKYKESWIVSFIDKKCSLEVLKHPKEYPKYLGIKRKKKKYE